MNTLPQISSSEQLISRYGLPNNLREQLLQQGYGDVALLLDALFYTNAKAGQLFTIPQIQDRLTKANIWLSTNVIRRAVKSGLLMTGHLPLRKRGRRPIVIHLPLLQGLVDHFCGGHWSLSDPLTAADLRSLSDYRQGLYRELIRRKPGSYSRQFLAARLGVTPRTTRNYDRAQSIRVVPRLIETQIDWFANWEDQIAAARPHRQWLRSKNQDGAFRDGPLSVILAEQMMGEGALYLVTQLSNTYSYNSEAQPLIPY